MSPRGIPNDRPNRSASPRPARKSMRQQGKLNFEQRPGFSRRVVNDVDGRVQDLEADSWACVTVPAEAGHRGAGDASAVGSVVRKPVGGGVTGVLMEIPIEWYEADQAEKEARRLEKETSLLAEAKDLAAGEGIQITRPSAGVVIHKP